MADVCLLGCGGIMPLPDRRLTALLFRQDGRLLLLDCGEGTQVGVKLAGWGFKAIDAIGFTHFHADHIAGLPGLLLTIGNSGRTEPLTLFGPPGLEAVVRCLCVICPLPFPLRIAELPADRSASFPAGNVHISSLPVDHSIPCLSYTLEIERPGRFEPARAKAAGIPLRFWKALQNGETVREGSAPYTPDMVLGTPRRGIRVGYCTDTRPTGGLPAFMEGCDLLICEGLYGDSALARKANEKCHMVFAQAATLARESQSRELWLTHYSPAMPEPEAYLPEAAGIFENARIGRDLMKKELRFESSRPPRPDIGKET